MKKQFVSLPLFLIAACGIFFSCGNISQQGAGALAFDSIQINETAHLFGDESKPACSLTINLAYVERAADETMKDSLNRMMLAFCLGGEFADGTPQAMTEAYRTQYVSRYRSDLEPAYRKEAEEGVAGEEDFAAWFSYYRNVTGKVRLYYKHLLVYSLSTEEYTGGAHGMYATLYRNWDLHTLKPLTLADIFQDDYEEELTTLLWKQLLANLKVSTREEAEEMGYGVTGDLTPTENFCLGREGITFHYNVYEIAPYSTGATDIMLPYAELRRLLADGVTVLEEVAGS